MNENNSVLKQTSKVALAAMSGLFILGMIFYKERSLFSDAAFRLFNLINFSQFSIPGAGNRYGALIVQVLPYLARKMHLSLNTILFCYGSSYYLFYLLVMTLLVYRYKQYALAILMAIYYFLFVSESFIWVSETFLGSGWMFLLFAVTMHWGNEKRSIVLLLFPFSFLAFLAIFTHFVVMIPLGFLWVYFMLDKKNQAFSLRNSIILCSVFVLVIVLKFADTSTSLGYDNFQLRGVTHFSLHDVINTFRQQVVIIFLYRCVVNYWLGILMFTVSVAVLIKNKEIKLGVWTLLSVPGYIIIMALTYGDIDKNTLLFHIESEWASIGILVAAPFVFHVLPRLGTKTAALIVAGIFIIRLAYIISFLPAFTQRNMMIDDILRQMRKKNITNLALYDDPQLRATAKLTWALPYESLMQSALHGDNPRLTFFFVSKDDTVTLKKISGTYGFFDAYYMLNPQILNKEYFATDSTHTYQIMTREEFFR